MNTDEEYARQARKIVDPLPKVGDLRHDGEPLTVLDLAIIVSANEARREILADLAASTNQ